MRAQLDKVTADAYRALTRSGEPVSAAQVLAEVATQLPSMTDADRRAIARAARKLIASSSSPTPSTHGSANKTLHALGVRLAHKAGDAMTAHGYALAARLELGAPDPRGVAAATERLRARFGASIDRAPGVEVLAFEKGAVYRERDGDRWRPVPSAITEGKGYAPIHYVGDEVALLAQKAASGEKTWAHKSDLSRAELDAIVGRLKSHAGPIVVDEKTGLPQNPLGKTGVSGRGESNLGPILAQDLLLTTVNPDSGERFAVFIKRKDTGRWAMPGGIEDAKDRGARIPTAVREFFEEAIPEEHQAAYLDRIADAFSSARQTFQGVCAKEPRNTDHMWFETTVFRVDIPWELASSLPLGGGDDASAAELLKVTPELVHSLHGDHPDFVAQALADAGP